MDCNAEGSDASRVGIVHRRGWLPLGGEARRGLGPRERFPRLHVLVPSRNAVLVVRSATLTSKFRTSVLWTSGAVEEVKKGIRVTHVSEDVPTIPGEETEKSVSLSSKNSMPSCRKGLQMKATANVENLLWENP